MDQSKGSCGKGAWRGGVAAWRSGGSKNEETRVYCERNTAVDRRLERRRPYQSMSKGPKVVQIDKPRASCRSKGLCTSNGRRGAEFEFSSEIRHWVVVLSKTRPETHSWTRGDSEQAANRSGDSRDISDSNSHSKCSNQRAQMPWFRQSSDGYGWIIHVHAATWGNLTSWREHADWRPADAPFIFYSSSTKTREPS